MGNKVISFDEYKQTKVSSSDSKMPCFQTSKEQEDFFKNLREKARKEMGYSWT